jgi:hypothetical protein
MVSVGDGAIDSGVWLQLLMALVERDAGGGSVASTHMGSGSASRRVCMENGEADTVFGGGGSNRAGKGA